VSRLAPRFVFQRAGGWTVVRLSSRPSRGETFLGLFTTRANDVAKPIHGRMPVMLTREDFAGWLEGAELPGPFPAERMEALAVGSRVNNARHEGPECLVPADGDGEHDIDHHKDRI
jgi:putative SOS response-associated peptidase YedK